jgi:tether containing UBX domain for GLUT4
MSLSELQLSPASVLLLRFEDDSLNRVSKRALDIEYIGSSASIDVHVTAPLLPDVLAKAVDLPIPPDPENLSQDQKPSQTPAAKSSSTTSKPPSNDKIPKWLKIGS